jgi:regulation of enolase protein 1 (concanavalin A-like superfamily)
LSLAGLAASLGLLAAGTVPVVAEEIPGWGTILDPSGDCTIAHEDGKVTITVPDGLYDLWFGRPDPQKRFNAPRVWRQVEGDFVAQVKVTADWMPDGENEANGAGLLIWDSEKQFVRRERHVWMDGAKPMCFVTPLYWRDDKRLDERKSAAADYFKGRSTWLRVERKGRTLKTAISHDGTEWTATGDLATAFPKKVWVGVHVYNVNAGELVVDFEEFSIRP